MIDLSTDEGVATLRIARPERRNAVDLAGWEALATHIAVLACDPQVRVIILTGPPGLFCAGADIAEMAAHAAQAGWPARNQAAQRACMTGLAATPQPVISVIDGDCIGAGSALALASDFRFATARARFSVPPAKLGIAYPRFDVARLVQAVGASQARRLLYTAAMIDADEALAIGFIDQIAEDPMAEALALAARILPLSAHSIAVSKAHVDAALAGDVDDDAESSALFVQSFARPEVVDRLAQFLTRKR